MVARVAAAAVAVAAELRTRPSAIVKAAVIPGARKRGCAEAVTRQTERVKAIKPITFMAKLLCFCFCDRRKRTTDWRVSNLPIYTHMWGWGRGWLLSTLLSL